MSDTAAPATVPATRTDVQWIGFVGSSTAFTAWLAGRLWFNGDVPMEVSGVIQYGVPLAMSGLAAEWRWRAARRRCPAVPADPAQ